jgi:hypothetical protein
MQLAAIIAMLLALLSMSMPRSMGLASPVPLHNVHHPSPLHLFVHSTPYRTNFVQSGGIIRPITHHGQIAARTPQFKTLAATLATKLFVELAAKIATKSGWSVFQSIAKHKGGGDPLPSGWRRRKV